MSAEIIDLAAERDKRQARKARADHFDKLAALGGFLLCAMVLWAYAEKKA